MAKTPKFSFKKQKPATGLNSVGYPYPDTTIKHDKQVVGYINAPNWQSKDNKWSISLMVNQPDGKWVWKRLKARTDSEPDARTFLQTHAEKILALDLHHTEPYDDE